MKKLLLVAMILCFFSACKSKMEVDLLIVNGTVFNGKDTIGRKQIIAIKGEKITFIGENGNDIIALKTIDADGAIVCPGFIDPHTHADRDLVDKELNHNMPFLMQGVTTVAVGNDGDSFFPTSKYGDLYKKQGIGTNVVMLTGHGTIRKQVVGKSDRQVSKDELKEMRALVKREMEQGSFGLSTGLFYAPGSYSNTDEVIALAKTVAENGGIYDTHLRDEGSFSVGLIAAVEEAIQIGRESGVPIHLSHIKCLGVDVWQYSDSIISLVENARKEGLEVTANQYPYDASATGLKAAVVPRWAESGGMDSLFIRYSDPILKERILGDTRKNIQRRGGATKLLLVKSEEPKFVGKNLQEVADSIETSPEEAVYVALKTGYIRVASFNMHPYDLNNFMIQPWVVTGSDGNTGHPRKYGSFPRKYAMFVKNEKLLDIGWFIMNSSSKTAELLKIPKRGKLQEGYYADLIIFDPNNFKDRAGYKNAFELAVGLNYSIVNGEIIVDKGEYNKKLNGKVLSMR